MVLNSREKISLPGISAAAIRTSSLPLVPAFGGLVNVTFDNPVPGIGRGESRVVRVPRRNKDVTLSGRALGAVLVERNASTSKI